MIRSRNTTLLWLVLLTMTGLTGGGCKMFSKPKPVAWNVSVNKATPASIEADVVGVSPSDKPYWMNNVKPDDYWKPNSPIRQAAHKVTTRFESGPKWELTREDPIWKDWFAYGATELMIMANLPGTYDNGPYDRRRLFLPLDKKVWNAKNHTLEVEIQDAFIRVLTPQKPHD